MAGFLKKVGLGILYVLVLPLLLVGLSIYALVGLCIFLFLGIKGIILFFQGRNLFGDLPEDILAKERMSGVTNSKPKQETTYVEVLTPQQPTYVNQNDNPGPVINNPYQQVNQVYPQMNQQQFPQPDNNQLQNNNYQQSSFIQPQISNTTPTIDNGQQNVENSQNQLNEDSSLNDRGDSNDY